MGVEHRSAGVAGIDGGVGLDAIGVFQDRAGRILIPVYAGYHAVGNRRTKVGCQQERVANGEAPVADLHGVAIGHFGKGEVVSAQQLDERHVAGWIDPDDHRVVQLAVGHAALHRLADFTGDVEIRDGVPVRRDNHAGAAALAATREDGHGRLAGALDNGHAGRFGGEHVRVDLCAGNGAGQQQHPCNKRHPFHRFALQRLYDT